MYFFLILNQHDIKIKIAIMKATRTSLHCAILIYHYILSTISFVAFLASFYILSGAIRALLSSIYRLVFQLIICLLKINTMFLVLHIFTHMKVLLIYTLFYHVFNVCIQLIKKIFFCINVSIKLLVYFNYVATAVRLVWMFDLVLHDSAVRMSRKSRAKCNLYLKNSI